MKTYERSWRWWLVKEKKQMGIVFIAITVMMFQLQMKGSEGCLETERIGLLELKSYLNSLLTPQDESILKSWSDDAISSDCCRWQGVNCSDAIGGHVVDLSLYEIMPERYLLAETSPPLPLNLSLLHSFPQLKTLNFSENGFTDLFDPIHGYKSFQRLENLHTLDLFYNHLNNSVLPFLSAARSLRTLDLGFNRLEGVFPPNELANMTKLRVLNLEFNGFSLFSVKGLINLTELEVLDLSYNGIKEVEAGDGLTTTKLKTLDLSRNNFSATAQLKGLQHLVELQVLRLVGNGLNHTISIQVLKDMPKLQELDLSRNEFTDLDSLGLQHLVELQVLSLADNRFNHTGSIQVLKDMPKLQELDLSYNEFTDLDSLGLMFPLSLQVLNLEGNQLSSTPKGYTEICRLTHLQELDLSYNFWTSMPYCLGNLTRLRTLDLSGNKLNGNLSSFISGLPSTLEYLSLLDYSFNGSFCFNSLINHTRLTVFKISSRVGTIQDMTESSWTPKFQLKKLKLQNFILGSKIPGFLLHQHDLRVIDLSHNKLTGAFPTWLVQNNTNLQKLLLNNNLLTELQLPRLVHGLQALDISSNKIYDSIQEDLGIVFPNLRYMSFSSNHFHGTIPSSMGEMKSLETLDMSSNNLSGKLPKTFLSGCNSLGFLKLSNNQFQGEIFPEHAILTGLRRLFLDGNSFNGSLGKGLLNSKSLTLLDISDNGISGTLPLWIGRMSRILRYLYMRRNQLKGPFPRQLHNLQYLEVIDISHNSFYGSIPKNLDFPYLKVLSLQSNEFMGAIPNSLVKAEELGMLDLRNNKFSGMHLNTIGKRSKLSVLLLRNNSLQSQIPKEICQVLSEVGILDMSHNKFKGVIPSCLGNMSFGAVRYDDSLSLFSGVIYSTNPPFFQDWSYASAFDLNQDFEDHYLSTPTTIVEFFTKSRYEAYQGGILQYMYGLDLASNQLSGEIPVEIGNLKKILSLNFSNNHLTGSIPNSFSKLEDLESLDLSNNKLDGNIPPQLADLDELGVFNVSFNNLSGEIPFNGHLGAFDEKSYIGNTHLCGLPTNKSCNPTGVPEPSASKQAKEEEEEEGDDVIDMVWFYWTCGAVYISTCMALFAFLSIDSHWSREWFYRVDLLVHHLQRFKRTFF